VNFTQNGVNTDHLFFEQDESISSGVAPIWVDAHGNNSIIIIPGSNDFITKEEIESARSTIAASQYVVFQMEIKTEITLEAMKISKKEGAKIILNPAPAHEKLSDEMYSLCDILCPNETELEELTEKKVSKLEDAIEAAKILLEKGVRVVVVTLGAQGSLLVTPTEVFHAPLETPVKAVDTTGAGDCFIGSLVYFLASGKSIHEAMKRANIVASLSVQKEGTQTSYPWRKDLPSNLFC